jgi:hypothetical protein
MTIDQKARRAKNRAEGLCSCGRPRMSDFAECEACRENVQRRRDERERQGVCRTCERPSRFGKKTCTMCAWRANDKVRQRRTPLLPMPEAPPTPKGAVGSQPWGILPAKPPGR